MPKDTHEKQIERLQRLRDFVVGLEGELFQLSTFQKNLGIVRGLSPEREWSRSDSLASQREARSLMLSVAKFVREQGEEFGFSDDADFFEDAIAPKPEYLGIDEVFDLLSEVSAHGSALLSRAQAFWKVAV